MNVFPQFAGVKHQPRVVIFVLEQLTTQMINSSYQCINNSQSCTAAQAVCTAQLQGHLLHRGYVSGAL